MLCNNMKQMFDDILIGCLFINSPDGLSRESKNEKIEEFIRYRVRWNFFKNECALHSRILLDREDAAQGRWFDVDVEEFVRLVPWANQFFFMNKKHFAIYCGEYTYSNGEKYQRTSMEEFEILIHESQIDYIRWANEIMEKIFIASL